MDEDERRIEGKGNFCVESHMTNLPQGKNQSSNKRIAKNTFLLYVRMLVLMLISLYTSRVILRVLGVEDFGVYNIVGGVVVSFSFLNGALASATQRYLNYELGTGDKEKLQRVFSSSIYAHILIIVGVVILCETVGLWFIETQLELPNERMTAALWAYQLSIFVFCLNIAKAPFNAVIIASEKMGFYAWLSIIEAVLKLAVVYMLTFISWDKLIVYSALLAIVSIIITLCYMLYCRTNYSYVRTSLIFDGKLVKEIFKFSTWSCYGNLSNIVSSQGLNFVLNIFFSVIANAAMGIANQVSSAIGGFIMNFQTAVNPQLIKLYASRNLEEMIKLIHRSSKLSFFLYAIIAFPLLTNTNYVLTLWLGSVPEYATLFCQLVLINQVFMTISGPLWVSAQATGVIKSYMLIVGTLNIISLPVAYLFMRLGYDAGMVLVAKIVMDLLTYIYRVWYLKIHINMGIREYMNYVLKPITAIALVACVMYYAFTKIGTASFTMLVANVCISVLLMMILCYSIGLSKEEKKYCITIIRKKLHA